MKVVPNDIFKFGGEKIKYILEKKKPGTESVLLEYLAVFLKNVTNCMEPGETPSNAENYCKVTLP